MTIATLAAAAGMAHGQVFTESFDGGLPGDWTVVDNEGLGMVWMTNADWGDDNYTNGSGLAAATNSDTFGTAEYDTELQSHTFVVPNGASLAASVNYQNLANLDFFDIDIRNASGGWDNLLSWNEDHGGFFSTPGEDVLLDISGYAGQSTQVRFHHYNPNSGDWDWYVQVDNVAVTPAPGAMALLGLGGIAAIRRRR
jgi:MYXO-CTERM domain-containing protein